jgi:hypothetical protein
LATSSADSRHPDLDELDVRVAVRADMISGVRDVKDGRGRGDEENERRDGECGLHPIPPRRPTMRAAACVVKSAESSSSPRGRETGAWRNEVRQDH